MIGDKDRNSCFSNSAIQMLMAFDEFRLVSFSVTVDFQICYLGVTSERPFSSIFNYVFFIFLGHAYVSARILMWSRKN